MNTGLQGNWLGRRLGHSGSEPCSEDGNERTLASKEEPHAERQPAVMSSEPLLSCISSENARKETEKKA